VNLSMADAPQVAGYPRPITAIHQIELTTHCNLRCTYCPSPKLDQPQFRDAPKSNMDMATFKRALVWCRHFHDQGTQHELSLTGIGETLLHPDWRDMVALARKVLPNTYINFSTNGLLLDDDACAFLAKHSVKVYVSLHRPEKAGPAVEAAKRHGIIDDVNASASISAFDWAGQVDWFVSAAETRCEWLYAGWGNVLVDGRISTCCLDAAGKGIVGHVADDPADGAVVQPWGLCASCHMVAIEPGSME
jgi:hypothetical protein